MDMGIARVIGVAAVFALASLVPVAHAVLIPFQNCLAESYRETLPAPLQWTPLYADAVFDPVGETHNLKFTVWGNVSGSFPRVENLPVPDNPAWTNPNETLGKILNNPEPDREHPTATTLISTVHVLSYRPYRLATDFCLESLDNGACPLAPVFDTTMM